ncbi:MAG: VOC family protein [Candidatus Binatia bacterium]
MKILSLGYVGFESPNAEAWKTFGTDIFGLGLAEPGADGTVYLRMDDRHHRLAIHPGNEDRLAYVGWELRDKAAFRSACGELERAGIEIRLGEREELLERRVQGFARFLDPAGYTHEIYYAPTFTAGSFLPGKPMAGGFVAGELGIGHVVVVVPQFTDELERFATEILGFELFAGYLAPSPDGRLLGPQFYRCNPRSHCWAYIAIPGMRGMQHMCLEAESLDDVGRAYDLVQQREIPVTMTLGRHMMDTLVSFYMRSPTGFDIEFGAGGALFDDRKFVMLNPTSPEVWGHKFVTQGWAPTVKPVGR